MITWAFQSEIYPYNSIRIRERWSSTSISNILRAKTMIYYVSSFPVISPFARENICQTIAWRHIRKTLFQNCCCAACYLDRPIWSGRSLLQSVATVATLYLYGSSNHSNIGNPSDYRNIVRIGNASNYRYKLFTL